MVYRSARSITQPRQLLAFVNKTKLQVDRGRPTGELRTTALSRASKKKDTQHTTLDIVPNKFGSYDSRENTQKIRFYILSKKGARKKALKGGEAEK